MQLRELFGEKWPEKKDSFDQSNFYKPYPQYLNISIDEKYKREGFNTCLSQLESLEVVVDVEKLSLELRKAIANDEHDPYLGIAKAIQANLKEILTVNSEAL